MLIDLEGPAVDEWRTLNLAIADRLPDGPPCAADPARWFTPSQSSEAASDCLNSCPVMTLCRTYALTAKEPLGVWGGMTPDELRAQTRRTR